MTLIADTPVVPVMTLHMEIWSDPVIDDLGHDPRSRYVERFWLPVLGPSTVWFLRRLADQFDAEPEGFDLDLVETARALGVGMRGGKHSPMLRTVDRACRFGASRMIGTTGLAVRRRLAPLTRAQVERLPASLQREHTDAVRRPRTDQTFDNLRTRARSLALSMLELGEDDPSIERQLHRWRFHPAMASDALRWAHGTHNGGSGTVAPAGTGTPPAPSRRITHVDRPRIGAVGIAVRTVGASPLDEAG